MPTEPAVRKRIYSKRKKTGLCPRCGGVINKNSNFIYCDGCREYYRGYNNEVSDSIQETRRERYQKRKEKGCCPRCGVFIGKKSEKTLCPKCLDKQYKYNTGAVRPKKTAVKKTTAAKKPVTKKPAAKKPIAKTVKKSAAKKPAAKKTTAAKKKK